MVRIFGDTEGARDGGLRNQLTQRDPYLGFKQQLLLEFCGCFEWDDCTDGGKGRVTSVRALFQTPCSVVIWG